MQLAKAKGGAIHKKRWIKETAMGPAFLFALLYAIGCAHDDGTRSTVNPDQQAPISDTLENVIYCADGNPNAHPLMCLPNTDYPAGRELTFKTQKSNEFVHVVFPQAAMVPKNLAGVFSLHGHYQGIQNWDAFKPTDDKPAIKTPPKDYRYFVVSSWEKTQ